MNGTSTAAEERRKKFIARTGFQEVEARAGRSVELWYDGRGNKILCTYRREVVVMRRGDLLTLHLCNKHVKRFWKRTGKAKVEVKFDLNKKGVEGLEYNGRFMPINALPITTTFVIARANGERDENKDRYNERW